MPVFGKPAVLRYFFVCIEANAFQMVAFKHSVLNVFVYFAVNPFLLNSGTTYTD